MQRIFLFSAVGVLVVSLIAGGTIYVMRSSSDDSSANTRQSAQKGEQSNSEPEKGLVGGVRRPASELAQPNASDASLKDGDSEDPLFYGVAQGVPLDSNPQVASVAKAIADRASDASHYGAATSALAGVPDEFDLNQYRSDPEYRTRFLSEAQPARVFQPAQPKKGVPRIQALGSGMVQMTQNEAVRLQVVVEPGSPVSFTSFDMGQFSNKLTSIVVEADKRGIAETTFIASAGTIDDVEILAASPAASGQAKFLVNIGLEESR